MAGSLFELVAKITLDTASYEGDLRSAEAGMDHLANKMGKGLETAAKIGAAAIAAATTAVVAFSKSAIDAGKVFDSSMSQVAATMGYTSEELNTAGSEAAETFEQLRNFAQEMGASTAFSASQAAEALNYMALAGYDASTSMEMLPNVLNLAAAGGIDLAYASDMVTDASSALGLSLDETAELVDKMAKASSKSNTSVSQLGEAILTVGGTAKNLVGGTTELATALGILADNGIKGSEGGTALRNIILAMTPTTDDAANAFERLSLDAYDANGNMRPLKDTFEDLAAGLSNLNTRERSQILNDIFNKVDLKSANALLAAAGDEIAIIAEALEDSTISWNKYIDEIRERTGDASIGITDLANEVSGFIRSMGATGMSAAEQLEVLQDEFGLTAEDAKAAFKIADTAIENHESRWEELTGYIDDAAGAAQAMADVQLDNLEGDITLFQSALEGAQIALSDKLTPILRDVVQFAQNGVNRLSEFFQSEGFDKFIKKVRDFLENTRDDLAVAYNYIVKNVIPVIEEAAPNIKRVIESIQKVLQSMWQSMQPSLSRLTDILADVILPAVAQIFEFLADHADVIVDFGEYILGVVIAYEAWEKAQKLINAAMKANTIGLIITALGLLYVAIKDVVRMFGDEYSAIKDVETAQKDLDDAIENTQRAIDEYVNSIEKCEDAYARLEAAEAEVGVTGEYLNSLVEQGLIDYQYMTDAQRELYKAYLDVTTAQAQLQDSITQMAEARHAEFVASQEMQIAIAKEQGSYEEYIQTVVAAFEEGRISVEEARDFIGLAMTEMSWSAKEVFLTEIPEAIREGFDPRLYETEGQQFVHGFTWLWEQISTGAIIAWETIQFVWSQVVLWFEENVIVPLVEYFNQLYKKILKFFDDLWRDIKAIWETVSNWFNNIVILPTVDFFQKINDILPIFSELWDAITAIWSGAASWFNDNVIQPIIGLFGQIAGGINDLLGDPASKLQKFLSKSSDSGSGNVLNSVPTMATGGVLRKGQMAFLEGTGAEAVVPLDQNSKWIAAVSNDMLASLKRSNASFGGGNEITINVYAAENQNVSDLAEEVNRRLWETLNEREAVWA